MYKRLLKLLKDINGVQKKTYISTLFSTILHEPFIALFGLLPFILRKDLGATIFQISLLSLLKPSVSLISFYWSHNSLPVRSNFAISSLLARMPFFFFPIFNNSWYLIFASSIYMLFSRASIPAWMEILKLNLPKNEREKLFSLSSVISYLESILLAALIGSILDNYIRLWQPLFILTAFVSTIAVFIQWQIPTPSYNYSPQKTNLLKPLKEGMKIIRERKDFADFQIGTMACGFGAMLMMPALILLYVDYLSLSHSEMSIGKYIFTGLGFVLLTPIWTRALGKFSPNHLLSLICLGFGIFPLIMLFALYNHYWIYPAFLFYGITQSGSTLVWHLSGTIFAKEENSLPFTSINVLMIGIRGIIAPLLSAILCQYYGSILTLLISIAISFSGALYMLLKYPLLRTKTQEISEK